MNISYFDDSRITEKTIKSKITKLGQYRQEIRENMEENNSDVPEYSLYYPKDFTLHSNITELAKTYKNIKHLVVIGIGGSNLGTEAIHQVLDEGKVKLSVLDTVSAYNLAVLLDELKKYKKATQLTICIISKSGSTTETLSNASVLIEELKHHFGEEINQQLIFIGDPKTEVEKYAKKISAHYVAMPKIIGGRYSVATAVGLIPLALLGHDTDEFISGYLDASKDEYETITAENSARLALYLQNKYHHYNFFAFEPRLEKLGEWYRQLFAESLGKETTKNGKPVKDAMLPTISTPVELHSVGQLYFSKITTVYTDFVTFDDEKFDFKTTKSNKLASGLKNLSLQEIVTGLYGGVIGAYQERELPYRATILDESLPYSLGLFMGMRLREIMYTANLMDVNAFDQPNVELYKIKTKEILKI
ncbi:MAG: Glucose-6-phosphate isomerase [Parcubacteria bacterium OLB19]|nr:MAG: Glucose-6-phosphate isomerase [Parcubacteria bacterium OLB19]